MPAVNNKTQGLTIAKCTISHEYVKRITWNAIHSFLLFTSLIGSSLARLAETIVSPRVTDDKSCRHKTKFVFFRDMLTPGLMQNAGQAN